MTWAKLFVCLCLKKSVSYVIKKLVEHGIHYLPLDELLNEVIDLSS